MRKLLAGAALTLTLLVAWPWLAERVEPLIAPADTVENPAQAISAQMYAAGAQKDATPVVLYFRYMQTAYLAQEARVLEIARNETVELAIVRALMAGPSAGSLELTPLFSTSDRLLSVRRENDRLVTVVLGEQFLAKPADAPQDWERYEYWVQEAPRRRRLAIQAIANALTENGRCDAVQFLVSAGPGDTQGTRMLNALFYGGDAGELLPPQTRYEEVVLTPRTALNVAFDAWQRKDWILLYAFLLSGSAEGATPAEDAPLPSQTEFLVRIAALERSLLFYRVSEGTVGVNGETATLCVTVKTMSKDGQTREIHQVPVEMVRERGSWKLAYGTLLRFLDE